MRLEFTPICSGRGSYQARIVPAHQQQELRAFEDWCDAVLPPPGELWSRFLVPMEVGGRPGQKQALAGYTLVIVFSDDALAGRFEAGWR
jgi:hypothetical protein